MLDFSIPTLVAQIINFVALLAILYFLVIRPLRARLAERSRELAESLQNARDQEVEASRLRAEWEQRMSAIREEADAIIGEAEREAALRRQALLEETRQRIDRLTEEMRADLVRQRDEIVAQNYDGILDGVIDVCGNVIQSVTTRRAHDDLVQNFCASVYRMPMEEIEEYRRAMAGRHALAVVSTPVALSAEQTKTLSDTLSSLIDRPVELQVRIVPELVAGIQVRIADRLMDNSVRHQLLNIRDRAREDLISRLAASA